MKRALWGLLFLLTALVLASCTDLTISGTVRDAAGNPVAGVQVTLSPENITVSTDGSGAYLFSGIAGGYHEVIPYLAGYRFDPEMYSGSITGDSAGNDFVAHAESGTTTTTVPGETTTTTVPDDPTTTTTMPQTTTTTTAAATTTTTIPPLTSNTEALSAIVEYASLQEGVYAELLGMFSDAGQKELFDGSITFSEANYDRIYALQQQIVGGYEKYVQAIDYLDSGSESSQKIIRMYNAKNVLPEGVLSSIKGFFYDWAYGSSKRARNRVLATSQGLDAGQKDELYDIAREKFGADTVGSSYSQFEQKLQNGDLDNQAHQLHSNFSTASVDYALAVTDAKARPLDVSHEEGAKGVKAGADVVVDSATTIVNAKFPGFSDGFDKGKEIVEDLDKASTDPVGLIKDKIKGSARDYLKDRISESVDLDELADGIAENASDYIKTVTEKQELIDNLDDVLDWGWGKLEGVFGEGEGATTPDDVGGILVKNTDDSKITVNLGDPSGDSDPVYVPPGEYDVITVADDSEDETNNAVSKNEDVTVPEGNGTVILIDVADNAADNGTAGYILNVYASPSDPGEYQDVTVYIRVYPAGSGARVGFSVSGTDGYANSGTLTVDDEGNASFYIPGGAEGVRDTVSVSIVDSGITKTFSYVF